MITALLDKVRAIIAGTTKLVALAGALVVGAAFLILAPEWTLARLGDAIGGGAHGVAEAGRWVGHFVHNATN